MKILRNRQVGKGIAMTEYLIILAIVAIAAIAVVGLFGKQIKDVFYRNTSTLGGTDSAGGNADQNTSASQSEAQKTDNMKQFDAGKNSGGQ